jgi:hypothetical protein
MYIYQSEHNIQKFIEFVNYLINSQARSVCTDINYYVNAAMTKIPIKSERFYSFSARQSTSMFLFRFHIKHEKWYIEYTGRGGGGGGGGYIGINGKCYYDYSKNDFYYIKNTKMVWVENPNTHAQKLDPDPNTHAQKLDPRPLYTCT